MGAADAVAQRCVKLPPAAEEKSTLIDCGASAIYYVNCDDCSIEGTVIHRADEWGLDIVGGSDNFVASNNTVNWSDFGGSIFHEYNSTGGSFTNNTFIDNNQQGVANCNALNVTIDGNTASPVPDYCTYP